MSQHRPTARTSIRSNEGQKNKSDLSVNKTIISNDSNSDSDSDNSLNNSNNSSRSGSPTPSQRKQPNKQGTCQKLIITVVLAALPVILGISNGTLKLYKKFDCNDTLNNDFFTEEVKLTVKTAVHEIEEFNRPSVLTFIYDKKSEDEVDSTMQKIVNFATCALNGGKDFVEVSRADVTSPDIIADKGKLITKYKAKLEEQNVMLVKHLEKVPGDVAMVFHFLCDQYVPVVKRALIVFTLQYNEEVRTLSDFDILEKVLTAHWNKLKADMIPPLIARLSNAIVKV